MPTITEFVAAFDAKAFNCTELLKSLAGGNRIINCHRQTNRNRHNRSICQNTWSTFFIRITCFFLPVFKEKKQAAHCTYVVCSGVRGGKFRASSDFSKILKDTKYFNTVKNSRADSVFQGKQKLLKHPECKKYIKYSEKFHDKLCFQGKCKFLKNPER